MQMSYTFRRRSSRWGSVRRLLWVLLLFVVAGTSFGWISSQREAERTGKRLLALEQQLAALKADGRVNEVTAYQLPAARQDLLAWQAYVLMHQAEALWRGAYESWLAGDWWVKRAGVTGGGQAGASGAGDDDEGELSRQGQPPPPGEVHSLLLATLRQELATVATSPYLNELVNRLRDVILGGEGEVSFPSRDELLSLRVLEAEEKEQEDGGGSGSDPASGAGQQAAALSRVVAEVKTRRHVPAYEWSGRAYVRDVTWQIELVSTPLGWRISRVSEQPDAR